MCVCVRRFLNGVRSAILHPLVSVECNLLHSFSKVYDEFIPFWKDHSFYILLFSALLLANLQSAVCRCYIECEKHYGGCVLYIPLPAEGPHLLDRNTFTMSISRFDPNDVKPMHKSNATHVHFIQWIDPKYCQLESTAGKIFSLMPDALGHLRPTRARVREGYRHGREFSYTPESTSYPWSVDSVNYASTSLKWIVTMW